MLTVNGKSYPMWSQIVEGKNRWIGGTLEEFVDRADILLFGAWTKTKITDIKLEPNGATSAYLMVIGEEFACGGDVGHLGIVGGENGYLTFSGYAGHTFRIAARKGS